MFDWLKRINIEKMGPYEYNPPPLNMSCFWMILNSTNLTKCGNVWRRLKTDTQTDTESDQRNFSNQGGAYTGKKKTTHRFLLKLELRKIIVICFSYITYFHFILVFITVYLFVHKDPCFQGNVRVLSRIWLCLLIFF